MIMTSLLYRATRPGLLSCSLMVCLTIAPPPARADFAQGVTAHAQGSYTVAFAEFLSLASQGNPKAQFNLGFTMYYNGQGVPRDTLRAAEWFRKAAEQDNIEAQYNLGVIAIHGEGVARDPHEAAHWLRKATEQGHVKAQYNLGVLFGKRRRD